MSAYPKLVQSNEPHPTAIELKDVQISFRLADGGRFDAVAESNLAVAENEFVAIVGPTGCGKSTLLNAVAGLLTPASGTVEISGQRLQGLNSKAGYLFQQDALMPWKTVLENVAIGLEIAGTPKAKAREQRGNGSTRSASALLAIAIRTCFPVVSASVSALHKS